MSAPAPSFHVGRAPPTSRCDGARDGFTAVPGARNLLPHVARQRGVEACRPKQATSRVGFVQCPPKAFLRHLDMAAPVTVVIRNYLAVEHLRHAPCVAGLSWAQPCS